MIRYVLFLLLLFTSKLVFAYKVEAHQWITGIAFDRSVLVGNSTALADFSLDKIEVNFPNTKGQKKIIRNLLLDGAKFEDDDKRSLNHFFDPQNGGRALTVLGIQQGTASPDWAIGDRSATQDYSLNKVRELFYQGLTGAAANVRDVNLGKTFESLGRAVHHLQDMTQPQHVRNDQHLKPEWLWTPWGSAYEQYSNDQSAKGFLPSGHYGAAGAVDLRQFTTARKFWENAGKGVAEFTSKNFVSTGTNFWRSTTRAGSLTLPHEEYPLPAPRPCVGQPLLQRTPTSELPGVTIPGVVDFVATPVADVLTGEVTCNLRTSTLSIFDSDLESAGWSTKFTLNTFNYDAAHQFLIPRAIAYSAGLINYFFRGRLRVEDVSSSNGAVTVIVRNVSAAEFALADSTVASITDEFEVWYDATSGARKKTTLTQGANLAGATIAADATYTLKFNNPSDVDVSKPNPYMVVFRGKVGAEEGVIGMVMKASTPAFLITPNYLPADGIAGPRVIRWNGSQWVLTKETGLEAGGVDWQGNNSGDVLTWGEHSLGRYFSVGGSQVYKDGRLLTSGPATTYGSSIVGASIRYVDGVRTLNVAMISDGTVHIYSRQYAAHYQNEDMWSTINPLGWREVYTGYHGYPFTGFFFNASGTEGQYITRDGVGPNNRIKIQLTGWSGAASTYPAVANVTRTDGRIGSYSPQVNVTDGSCVVPGSIGTATIRPSSSDPCGKTGYTADIEESYRFPRMESYSGHTVFCVDYKGDSEVFCELLPPKSADMTYELTRTTNVTWLEHQGSTQSCGVRRNATKYNEAETRMNESLRLMRIGSAEIPWSGTTGASTHQYGYEGDYWAGGGFGKWIGSGTDEGRGSSRASSLIYADARFDTIAYQTNATWYESHSQYSYPEIYDGYMYGVSSSQYVSSTKVALNVGDSVTTLFERNTPDGYERSEKISTGTLGGGVPCNVQPRSDDNVSEKTVKDAGATDQLLSNTIYQAWYAVSESKRTGASQLIQIPAENNYPFYSSYWTSLTDGSLLSLLPGSEPAGGRRFEIRLIR